jgi:pimeloyl-ACP methyl ester carboxylesterase
MKSREPAAQQLASVCRQYADGRISRRELFSRIGALGAGGLSVAALGADFWPRTAAAQRRTGAALDRPLAIAEQGQFWVGAERASVNGATVSSGEQMYVWYQVPADVKKPYPIVLVHGGGGQGTDYLGTPFGAPGWATYLLQEGYAVYVVDRPGLGRPPFYPQLLGEIGEPLSYEQVMDVFTAMRHAEHPHAYAHFHTQWPGSGMIGDPALDQFMAGTGPSMPDRERSFAVWRYRGSELLDRIGPAVMMTHSAGGPFGWLTGDARPQWLKALVAVEPAGPVGAPLTYDPPVLSMEEIKTVMHTPSEPNVNPYPLQAAPVRDLVNLKKVPMTVVLSEASSFNLVSPGTVAYLQQAGCNVELLRLADHGVHGNGHFMMMEKNNREALQPILDWLDATVS